MTSFTFSGDSDTAGCWMNQLNQFLSPSSPALEAAKLCTVDYHNRYHGTNETFTSKHVLTSALAAKSKAFLQESQKFI